MRSPPQSSTSSSSAPLKLPGNDGVGDDASEMSLSDAARCTRCGSRCALAPRRAALWPLPFGIDELRLIGASSSAAESWGKGAGQLRERTTGACAHFFCDGGECPSGESSCCSGRVGGETWLILTDSLNRSGLTIDFWSDGVDLAL